MPLTLPAGAERGAAPVINSTPDVGVLAAELDHVRSAGVKLSDRALRTSGRLSVMIATRVADYAQEFVGGCRWWFRGHLIPSLARFVLRSTQTQPSYPRKRYPVITAIAEVHRRRGILDHPPEPVIGRPLADPFGG